MKRTKNSSAGSSKRRKVSNHQELTSHLGESEEIAEGIAVKNEKKKTDYAQFFRYEFKSDLKVGVCLLCKNKDPVEIPMMQSNTSGLKKHLSNYHVAAYESLFGLFNSNQKLDKFITRSVSEISQSYTLKKVYYYCYCFVLCCAIMLYMYVCIIIV